MLKKKNSTKSLNEIKEILHDGLRLGMRVDQPRRRLRSRVR